jgi:Ran GTPase-activating protein (RanGAP) involved in mRNA processing and transport
MSIEELNLGDNGLDIDGIICVTSVLNWNNSTLRSLNLDCPDYRSIGQECAVHYAKMLQVNRGLEKLSLRKNLLNCDAIYTIKQLSMENNRLRVLDLAANKIAFKGAEALHDLLTSKFCVL